MRRLLALSLIALIPGLCPAQGGLEIAISKRIPCETDTVRLAAHLSGWAPADREVTVMLFAEREGVERPIGKTRLATDAADPFSPCVEWAPGRNGTYRIIAREEGSRGPVAHDATPRDQATPGGFALAGKLFVPVVVQDLYFCWYGQTQPETQWMTHHLTAAQTEISALRARGVKALKHATGVGYLGGPRWEDIRADVDWRKLGEQIVSDYTQVAPYDGIAIDELGMWDDHPEQTQLAMGFWEALKQARAAAPDNFVAAWQFAALTPLECNMFRDTVDLVMCEVYQNYFRAWHDQHTFYEFIKQRIDVARAMMILKQTVIGLSVNRTYGGVTPQELEDQIRFIRATGPEMRGLAFFTTSDAEPEVLRAADQACYRYFVKPAVGLFSEADLTLSEYQPRAGGTVRISATVHNVGGMDAKHVVVRFYDGDRASGGKQIGTDQIIPRLPAAHWVDPEARDDRSAGNAEAMRRDGFGMATVTVPWKATAGTHELWAQVIPSDDYTTIRAEEKERVVVR